MTVQPATLPHLGVPARAVEARRRRAPGWVQAVGDFARRKPLGALGGFIVILLLVVAAGARWLAPYPYDVGVTAERLQAPSLAHPFGTDANGRDLLSRIIWGARMSVTIGFGAVLISTVLAVTVGVWSGPPSQTTFIRSPQIPSPGKLASIGERPSRSSPILTHGFFGPKLPHNSTARIGTPSAESIS